MILESETCASDRSPRPHGSGWYGGMQLGCQYFSSVFPSLHTLSPPWAAGKGEKGSRGGRMRGGQRAREGSTGPWGVRLARGLALAARPHQTSFRSQWPVGVFASTAASRWSPPARALCSNQRPQQPTKNQKNQNNKKNHKKTTKHKHRRFRTYPILLYQRPL